MYLGDFCIFCGIEEVFKRVKKICMELVLLYGLFFVGGFKNIFVNIDGFLMC